MKRCWDEHGEPAGLGSGEGTSSAGASPQRTASSSLSGPREAKRERRSPGQPQQPQRPRAPQQAAGSSGSGGPGGHPPARQTSPTTGLGSKGLAQAPEAAAASSQPSSPAPAGLPNTITTGLGGQAGLLDSTAASLQRTLPQAAAGQLAAPQTPPTSLALVQAAGRALPPEPLPSPPLLPAQQWRMPPAASGAFPVSPAAPASMQATPGVHMLHVVVPRTAHQRWPLQLMHAGGTWGRDPMTGAACQPASPRACSSAAPQPPPQQPASLHWQEQRQQQKQWQQEQQRRRQAAAAAVSQLLWEELAQLASPGLGPDTCSLRRYEEEQRRYEERWRQYQRAAQEEEGRAERAPSVPSASGLSLGAGGSPERSQQAEQARQEEPAHTPLQATRPQSGSQPAVACGPAPLWRSPFAAAASASASGPLGGASAEPSNRPPAQPFRDTAQAEAQRSPAQALPAERPSRPASACSFDAELVTLYSAWQDGQASLSLTPN